MDNPISYFNSLHKETKRFLILVILILILSGLSSAIQSDFGQVDVEIVEITDQNGNSLSGKIYRPVSATNSSPASAVLLLHGLNNDKDTQAPTAIELSRRGIVALALDEHNHGDSEAVGAVLETSSNQDTSLGAIAAFDYLASVGYVSPDQIGLAGHSMGGFAANATAKARPSHQAIVFQAFGPLNLTNHNYFNNYLQIWPRYEESALISRDEWISQGTEMITYNVESFNLSTTTPVYGTTYGSFTDGTAQRYALIDSTHPGGTWQDDSVKETVAWMLQALEGESSNSAYSAAEGQIYYLKEGLMLIAVLFSLAAMIPLAKRLLDLDYFESINAKPSEKRFYENGEWWRVATINSLIGGITFVIFPFIGVLLFGALNSLLPIFNLLIGNAFIFWFLLNAVIAHLIHRRWKSNQEGITQEDLGGISKENPDKVKILAKTFLLATTIIGVTYLLASTIQWLFSVELRYMWPFFRDLEPARFFTFIVYLIPVLYFFLINGGVFLFGQARVQHDAETTGDMIKWWGLNSYNMLSTIILVFLIEYGPMILFGTGPLLGGVFGVFWLLGIFLMQIIPEFLVLFLIMTILYKKTGRYYLGSILSAMIVTWVMVHGAFA